MQQAIKVQGPHMITEILPSTQSFRGLPFHVSKQDFQALHGDLIEMTGVGRKHFGKLPKLSDSPESKAKLLFQGWAGRLPCH